MSTKDRGLGEGRCSNYLSLWKLQDDSPIGLLAQVGLGLPEGRQLDDFALRGVLDGLRGLNTLEQVNI